MSATDDWGPDVWPDHYWTEGCCELEEAAHPDTPQQAAEALAWFETEPGLRQRLALRQSQLARLEEIGAPEVILARQRAMITETEAKLAGETDV